MKSLNGGAGVVLSARLPRAQDVFEVRERTGGDCETLCVGAKSFERTIPKLF